MIKLKLRKNLLYLFLYYVPVFINLALEIFGEIPPIITIFLNIFGTILGGLVIYLYQYHLIKRNKQSKYFGINLIYNEKKTKAKDGIIKIGLLLIFASYFYSFNFIIRSEFDYYIRLSPTIYFRLSSIQTISASLICTYALGFEMKKHHKLALINISIFLVLTFIIETIYSPANIYIFLLILYYYICETFSNCIEKYLADINYINPFLILMLEGIIEFIMACAYFFLYKKYIFIFSEIKKEFNYFHPKKKSIKNIFLDKLFFNVSNN